MTGSLHGEHDRRARLTRPEQSQGETEVSAVFVASRRMEYFEQEWGCLLVMRQGERGDQTPALRFGDPITQHLDPGPSTGALSSRLELARESAKRKRRPLRTTAIPTSCATAGESGNRVCAPDAQISPTCAPADASQGMHGGASSGIALIGVYVGDERIVDPELHVVLVPIIQESKRGGRALDEIVRSRARIEQGGEVLRHQDLEALPFRARKLGFEAAKRTHQGDGSMGSRERMTVLVGEVRAQVVELLEPTRQNKKPPGRGMLARAAQCVERWR